MISILITTEGQTNISNTAYSRQIIWMVFFFLDSCENQRLWWPPSELFTLSPAPLWSLLHFLSGQPTPSAVGPLLSPASPSPCTFCSYSFLSGLLLFLSTGETSLLQGLPFQSSPSSRQWAQRALWESSNSDDLSFSYPPPPIPLLCLLASGPWALGTVSNGECLLMNRAAPILLELAT